MSVIASICARGGSQGLPGKNVKMLAGKPLIAHSIEQALMTPEIDAVYVSTDDAAIADVARSAGAKVPFLRPAKLAGAQAAKIPVIQHLYDHLCDEVTIDCMIDLDPTSPLRLIEDIQSCLRLYQQGDYDLIITGYEAEKNPYFNMVELDANKLAKLCKAPPDGLVVTRQSAPKVYAMNASIYVWRPSALTQRMWDLRIGFYEMPRNRSIDIDDAIDFKLVEILMQEAHEAK